MFSIINRPLLIYIYMFAFNDKYIRRIGLDTLFLGVISVSWVYIGHIDLYMRFTLYKVTLGLLGHA